MKKQINAKIFHDRGLEELILLKKKKKSASQGFPCLELSWARERQTITLQCLSPLERTQTILGLNGR